ncbi:MAG TPA: extracellular solute-binding protein [Candidatus Lustribacter sp.]|jgi:iron(III) transport system substrate-binding protein|nr:extracellular solute-binding protein [Candidatus Lustribacter sp.]
MNRRTVLAGAGAALVAGSTRPAGAQSSALDALVTAAKAEGTLTMDGPPGDEVRQGLLNGFQRAYGIPISYIPSGSSSSSARIRAERASGKYVLDVFLSGADAACITFLPSGWLDRVEPVLVAPDVLDKSKWKDGHLWYEDDAHTILRILNTVAPGLAVNTKLVKPAEVATWKSLLEPKWQAKIIAKDPLTYGAGSQLNSYFYITFGPEYVKKLYQVQQPVLSRNARQAMQWLAEGSYPILLGPDTASMIAFKKLGYPIEAVIPTDGPGMLNCGWGLICLMNKAPHPNAAKLFVNWLSGTTGQTIYANATQSVSLRTDVKYDNLPAYLFPQKKTSYMDTSDWKFVTQTHEDALNKVQALLGK